MSKSNFMVGGISCKGTNKEVNEDHFVYRFLCEDNQIIGMAAVADGVGSLKDADVASKMTISHLNQWWEHEINSETLEKDQLIASLECQIRQANDSLVSYGLENQLKTATTLSVILILGQAYEIFHVGDSRIYKTIPSIGKEISQLTTDHSKEVEKQIEGQTKIVSALTSYLGYSGKFELFRSKGAIGKKDIYLLCSDGLYKTVDPGIISTLARRNKRNMGELCEQLLQEAKNNKEADDISIIAVSRIV